MGNLEFFLVILTITNEVFRIAALLVRVVCEYIQSRRSASLRNIPGVGKVFKKVSFEDIVVISNKKKSGPLDSLNQRISKIKVQYHNPRPSATLT